MRPGYCIQYPKYCILYTKSLIRSVKKLPPNIFYHILYKKSIKFAIFYEKCRKSYIFLKFYGKLLTKFLNFWIKYSILYPKYCIQKNFFRETRSGYCIQYTVFWIQLAAPPGAICDRVPVALSTAYRPIWVCSRCCDRRNRNLRIL